MDGLARLGVDLPLAWIEEALEQTGMASIRRRRLPAEQVVWLVIALALFRRTSMSEVLESLDLAIPNGDASAVSRGGISQARQRLGFEPLAVLFERTSRAWCALDAPKHAWRGLSLWAMDGTTFRTPDSPDNRATFGAQGYASGKAASYPQVRGVTLTALPTRLVADAAFGEYDINEMRYAEELVPRIPDHSLTIFDKGFFSAAILLGLSLSGEQRHFLIPSKAHTKWEVVSGTPDDAIVQMKVSPQARADFVDRPAKVPSQ
ncbi:MAG: family transposase [Holophagaceae bacterium]|nr:family transposase [Holophagaceae bacterium]